MSETTHGPTARTEPRGGSVKIFLTYFTDPLCCWSWGFEPQLGRLRYAYAGRLAWRVRMGGMIHDWNHFGDPLNAVHRPGQMAPLWLQASSITGMPLKPNIWITDPPASSWPSCLAVKAAELQSPIAAGLYLRLVREAVMVDGRNIARQDVLLDLADALEAERADLFSAKQFRSDINSPGARSALQDDIKEARFRGIGRFPSIVIHLPEGGAEVLVGWRPYTALRDAVLAAAPGLGRERQPESVEAYRTYWGRITDREVAEATDPEHDAVVLATAAIS